MTTKIISLLLLAVYLLFAPNVYAKVLINEFLIEPNQTVELINIGSDSADISGWYIDDSGGTTYFTIPEESIIEPNACMVFSSNFNLNKTTTDTIRLFDNSTPPTSVGSVPIDSFSYPKSPGLNISYMRLPDGDGGIWSTGEATLESFNETKDLCVIIPSPTPTPPGETTDTLSTPTPIRTPTPTRIPTPRPTRGPTPTRIPTPTKAPTLVLGTSTASHPPPLYLTKKMTIPNSIQNKRTKSEILGEIDMKEAGQKRSNLPKKLSFISFSYSILTIVSILFRMKMGI